MSRAEQLRETAARWNPVRVGRRAVRRFSRRPRAMQVRTIAVIVAVIAGLVVYVATAPEPQQAPTPFGGLGGGSVGAGLDERPDRGARRTSDPAGVGDLRVSTPPTRPSRARRSTRRARARAA